MGRNIKRLSLALLALGLSAPAFAYCDNPFAVTVPNQQGGFTVGADALWLRPSDPALTYGVTWTDPVGPFLNRTRTINLTNVNPSYHWGFDVMAAYRIPCTGNDIALTWTHLNQSSDSSNALQRLPNLTIGIGGVARTFINTLAETSSVQYKYDAVDLDLGQRVNFGDRMQFRLLAGVRFADLKRDRNNAYALRSAAPGVPIGPIPLRPAIENVATLSFDSTSEFKGVGPRVGLEGRYCLGAGFGVDAGAATSLLVGRTQNDSSLGFRDRLTLGNAEIFNFNRVFHIDVENKNRVVPTLDANLGLDYTYNFNNCSRSSLVVQAGYKVIHYWDVVHSVDNNINHASSVSFDGPYAGIKVNV